MKPYIGITDFTTYYQVVKMLEIFYGNKPPNSDRVLHVGVMTSYKTLNDIKSKWSNTFPPKETISDIFCPNSEEPYYCLHYADYNGDTRPVDIYRALDYAGEHVNALQLDMPWPEPGLIINGVYPSAQVVEVILQVGKTAIEEAGNDPAEVVRRLKDYDSIIDRVLLDKSMGRGLGMNAEELLPFLRAIKEHLPELGLVVAGGLGPTSLHLVEPIIEEFPDISIDAQGKLRPSGNALDPIDWDMAGDYLAKALKLFP